MTEKRFISKDESIINVATDELVNASSEESAKILVNWLNELHEKNEAFLKILENQSYIIDRLESELLKYQLKEPIVFKKEDLEIMGKAISYYTHGECPK